MTKTSQIRKLLAKGMTAAEISAKLQVSRQSVYGVRYYDKHNVVKRNVGRPRKIKTVPDTFWQRIKKLFAS